MAKTFRRVVGSVCKAKDAGKPDYVKIKDDVVLKKGQTLRLESKKFQLDSLEGAVKAGKLSPDIGSQVKERIEKMTEWVRFEIVSLETKSE